MLNLAIKSFVIYLNFSDTYVLLKNFSTKLVKVGPVGRWVTHTAQWDNILKLTNMQNAI